MLCDILQVAGSVYFSRDIWSTALKVKESKHNPFSPHTVVKKIRSLL